MFPGDLTILLTLLSPLANTYLQYRCHLWLTMALAIKFGYFASSPLNLLFKFCAQAFNIPLRKLLWLSIFLLRIYNNSIFLSFNYILREGKFYSFRTYNLFTIINETWMKSCLNGNFYLFLLILDLSKSILKPVL